MTINDAGQIPAYFAKESPLHLVAIGTNGQCVRAEGELEMRTRFGVASLNGHLVTVEF